jgi:hypothetical protein
VNGDENGRSFGAGQRTAADERVALADDRRTRRGFRSRKKRTEGRWWDHRDAWSVVDVGSDVVKDNGSREQIGWGL